MPRPPSKATGISSSPDTGYSMGVGVWEGGLLSGALTQAGSRPPASPAAWREGADRKQKQERTPCSLSGDLEEEGTSRRHGPQCPSPCHRDPPQPGEWPLLGRWVLGPVFCGVLTCSVCDMMRVAKPSAYNMETEPDVAVGSGDPASTGCPRWALTCDPRKVPVIRGPAWGGGRRTLSAPCCFPVS